VEGQIVTLEPQKLEVCLSASGRIAFSGTVLLHEKGNTQRVSFTAVISPRTLSQPLLLEAFHCTEGEGISLELVIALMNKAKELLKLPFFEVEGMALRIKNLEVQEGSLTLYTEAYVRQIPDLSSEG
jgi:hypothetical protein